MKIAETNHEIGADTLEQPEHTEQPAELAEQPEHIEQPEQLEQVTGRIRQAKEWTKNKFGQLLDSVNGDVKLNEDIFKKLSPQLEDNRRQVIQQKYDETLALLKKTEDTEKYFDEQFEELEWLANLKTENFAQIKPEEFASLSPKEKMVLKSLGLVKERVAGTEDPDELMQWANMEGEYGAAAFGPVEAKLAKQAAKARGSDTKDPYQLLHYAPYEKFKVATGRSGEKEQAIFRREKDGEMDEQTAKEFFEAQFNNKNQNYGGNAHLLASYLENVPPANQNPELVAAAKQQLVERYSEDPEDQKAYEQLLADLDDPSSAASASLKALWKGDMDISPFDFKHGNLYDSKNAVLQARIVEILKSPERGQAYLDYFVNKCGIKNIDRFSTDLLDKVYAERNNTEKPYGLMIQATADNSGSFGAEQNMHDDFYKTLSQNGHRLLLSEADSDRAVLKNIQNAVTRQGGKKISFMVVAGHGEPDSIHFGNTVNVHRETPKRKANLEQDDDTQIRMTVRASRKYIEPGAEVLAISCSTGMKTEKSTYPIAESTANRTGLKTKGLSKPLAVSNLRSYKKPDGRIGLDIDVQEPMTEGGIKNIGIPAEVMTFEAKNYKAESYDYLAKSGK